MSGFSLVDPQGWEYDLQSVFSAYIGYFQLHSIPWYERSWGHLFESFEDFLAFSWPVITVTDARSGRAHIVTRMTSIGAFLKMIKTRFGETLPIVDNMFQVEPFETSSRHLRTVSDWPNYKKLHSSLSAVAQAAFRARVKSGDVKAIREVWEKKDKIFLAMDFEWSERNQSSCLEWGYAAVRCGHLTTLGHWPPLPDTNYRKGHYVVAEYADKIVNRHSPTFPWLYAFGESQLVPKVKLQQIIQAVLSSHVSPDSDTTPNNVVLVGHGISGDLARLEEMKIKLPHNILIVDTHLFEKNLFSSGDRGPMLDAKGKARLAGSSLSLDGLLRSLNVDVPCQLHNSGNDAFMTLFALQKLFEPETPLPTVKARSPMGMGMGMGNQMQMARNNAMLGVPMVFSGYLSMPPPTSPMEQTAFSPYPSPSEYGPPSQNGYLGGEDSHSPVRRARASSKPNNGRDMRRMSGSALSFDPSSKKHISKERDVLNASMRSLALN